MNIKTISHEDYVNYVNSTKKQNIYVIIILVFFLFFSSLFFQTLKGKSVFLPFIRQMSNTFSLDQISKTGNLDANLKTRHYKLNVMAQLTEHKCKNLTSKQSEIAKNRYVKFCSTTA